MSNINIAMEGTVNEDIHTFSPILFCFRKRYWIEKTYLTREKVDLVNISQPRFMEKYVYLQDQI